MLTIALSKGKLIESALDLFRRAGYEITGLSADSRRLIFVSPENDMTFLIVRSSDVPTYVEYGGADAGIVGKDVLMEQESDEYEPLDLGFGECRISVASGILLLGRPYHHDPGLNHGIPEELQKLGYAVFSQSTLPLDADLLERLFGDEVRAGVIRHPLDISDVWKHSTSASSNHKLWAAKFTARHPNLVAVELSNFKCGHDAPIYATIEEIIEKSGTPYFGFKDIDENKPVGAIKLRLETIDYSVKRARESMLARGRRAERVEKWLTAYERKRWCRRTSARDTRQRVRQGLPCGARVRVGQDRYAADC